MKLLIAIPALNEEDSIESTIRRSLEAREYIRNHSAVDEVEITVVSDGSTDRTVEVAGQYTGLIRLIVFDHNRGYGAAIKEAWRQSDADLLGFLDADGTCDPTFFAPLCVKIVREGADVVLGCRLNRNSKMPLIRRIGNSLFAMLLSAFSSSRVRDTASGMRVVRRTSLEKLFPLPDGLHFTPAMSARAMLSDKVKIVEIDMPYHERAGESKLSVAKDGLRFLRVILVSAFLYQPARPLGMMAMVMFLGAAMLMIQPIIYYLTTYTVAEWMIYRFLVSHLFGVAACMLLCASHLTDRMVSIALTDEIDHRDHKRLSRFFQSDWFWTVPATLVVTGGLLVAASVLGWLRTGANYEHWSRYVVMTFCFSVAVILSVTRGIETVLSLLADRLRYLSAVFAEQQASPSAGGGEPMMRASGATLEKAGIGYVSTHQGRSARR